MRVRRDSIIIGFLVLIAGLATGSRTYVHSARLVKHSEIAVWKIGQQPTVHHRLGSVVEQGESSDPTRHERRHVKSLVSQAIVAACPITILPDFTYYHRHYSLYLPGGCNRRFTGNFSLRGPPVC